ncbi:MAG: SDR family oxidoreductase [Marinosulfonomonas sp.]
MKILILGGYGVFGGHLAELLADQADLHILIAGRNLKRAEQFCASFLGAAHVEPIQLDRTALQDHIEPLAPDLVVDASGPFQDYGDDRYHVIQTCIDAGVNYLDFADGADFVCGVDQFDQAARDAGVFVLSGVSSCPVLTSAALREMAKTMEIVTVRGGIAPSPFAGIGLNVIRAVLGYAGAPVKLTRNGQETQAIGLGESLRYTIAVPGKMPLRNIRFSLVDVPDLQLLPGEYPTLTDIWMGAGPVPELLHRCLNLLARARAALHLPRLTPLAPLFHKVLNLMKFGEHRGGMFVHATGLQNGTQVEQSWHLLAEGDNGPFIPSMGIAIIVQKCLRNAPPAVGVTKATQALTLSEYDALFKSRNISSGLRRTSPIPEPLYRQVLDDAFQTLPAPIQAIHDDTETRVWSGTANIRQGTNVFAKMLCAIFGFPPTSPRTPVEVQFECKNGTETWKRRFGKHGFTSHQKRGTGRNTHLIVERFGPISIALALVVRDEKLYLISRRWTFLGLPLPALFLPGGEIYEAVQDGTFQFNVEIRVPLIGLLVAYTGTLSPVEP